MPVMMNTATGVFGYVDMHLAQRLLDGAIDRLDAAADAAEMVGGFSTEGAREYSAAAADAWQLLLQLEAEARMDEGQAQKFRRSGQVLRDFWDDDSDPDEKVGVSHDPRTDTYVVTGGGRRTLSYKSYEDADAEGYWRTTGRWPV